MDKKKQSILKQEGRIPLQEMGLPDFPDDDTGTVTVTKSRRVSFGANFVKEFIVGSAISTQFYSEYEQAFSSSDSSNPNSSHSGLLNQSSGLDNAINLCVKPAMEEELVQVKKKVCLENQQISLNVNETINDRNWDFNVSNNSNIFAEKNNFGNRSENFKYASKGIKKPCHNDSFVPGEKYFQNKQADFEVNSSKFNDNLEKKNKPGKFSSTICFSVDSPTADMEFTEGCINLAKSIFDKKNKEMTVYIQEKKGNEKKEGKTSSGDIIFDGSEVEMSLTKCVHNQSEDDSFMENELFSSEGPSAGILSDGSNESPENTQSNPIHMYNLNTLLQHNNTSQEDSDLERSLFFPEGSLTELLNSKPVETQGFNDKSPERDNNEECNMELSVCEPVKICTSNNLSSDKDNKECYTGLRISESLKVFLPGKDSSLEKDSNEKFNMKMTSPKDIKMAGSNDISLDKADNRESDMELSLCEPVKTTAPSSLPEEKDNDGEYDMEISISEAIKTTAPSSPPVEKDNDGNSDMEISISEAMKTTAPGSLPVEKDNDGESDMEISISEAIKTTAPSSPPVEKDNDGDSDMEISISEAIKTTAPSSPPVEKDNDGESDMEISICEPLKTPVFNNPTEKKNNSREDNEILTAEFSKIPTCNENLTEKATTEKCNEELSISESQKTFNYFTQGKNNSTNYNVDVSPCVRLKSNDLSLDEDYNEECKIESSNSEPFEISLPSHPSLDNDNNRECTVELPASGPLQTLVPEHSSPNIENNEECNMELSICEPLKTSTRGTPPQKNGNNEDCNVLLSTSQPSKILLSTDSALDSDNIEECPKKLSPCGYLRVSSNDLSINVDKNEGCNMELTSESLSENSGNVEEKKEGTVNTVEVTNQEENNEVENSSKGNKYLRCSFIHIDMEPMEDINKEPEIETCVSDPLSVSICQEDISLNECKNEKFDVETMDGSTLKIFTYDQSLRKGTGQEEENNEILNSSTDSSFLEVVKEAVEEVNNGSFIKKSVIDLFRSTVIDTDVSLNEDYNPKKTQSPLKMQFTLDSPAKDKDKEKSQKVNKMADELRTIDSVSEGDKKIIALLREQAQETNCLWKIESFAYNGDCRCWSFSSSLFGSLIRMKFRLMPPKDMSVVSFSIILERNIELLKTKEFQSEKIKTTVEFAFEKIKNYFDPESRSLGNVHNIPLFLDRMNYYLARINKVVEQLVRILKEYPGSRLKKSILSFRLHSFPLMFSLAVMVDVNDPLQLSESCITFEKHFGNFSTNDVKSVFNYCLKSEEVLIQFIQRSIQLIISKERLTGCVTNRSYIRLVT